MALVVTGISPTPNISALETALRDAGCSLEHIQVVEPGDEANPISPSSIARGAVGDIETGTGVPGLTDRSAYGVGGTRYFRNESLSDRLADFDIPDDEVDNYLDALAAGRSVVAYFARADDIDRVEGVFRAAGLARVKRF